MLSYCIKCRTNKIKNEIDEIRKLEEKIKRNNLKYKTKNVIILLEV